MMRYLAVGEIVLHSIIRKKDKGGLTYPSDGVVKICIATEKSFKYFYEKFLNKYVVITNVLKNFINNDQILSSINDHVDQNGPLDNHIILLIKAIISSYYDININSNCWKQNETVSLRTWYNKLFLKVNNFCIFFFFCALNSYKNIVFI